MANQGFINNTIKHMEIKILPHKNGSKHKNEYCIQIEYMYGDADGEGFDHYYFKKPEDVCEFALFCEKCIATYSESGRGNESYDIVPDYNYMEIKYGYYPHFEPMSDGECEATFVVITCYWYDANGIVYDVELTYNEDEQIQINMQKQISWEDYDKIKKSLKKGKQK